MCEEIELYFSELEIIEYFNNQQGIEVINADVIYNPIQSINITRDSNLKIILFFIYQMIIHSCF